MLFPMLAVLLAVLAGVSQAKFFLVETAYRKTAPLSHDVVKAENRRFPHAMLADNEDGGDGRPVPNYPLPKMSPGCKVHPDEPWNFNCT